MNTHRRKDPRLEALHKDVYMPMLQTAEVVAKRYGISRELQDEYGLESQRRTAAAQAAGVFADEIISVTANVEMKDKKTGELLGAHMVGTEVTELIQGYGIAMTLETTEAQLMETVFPHPTLSEMMHEAVLDAYGRVIHI
jgi:acetyl-CoA acetyltransferase